MWEKTSEGETSLPSHKAKISLLFLFFDLNYYQGMCYYRGMLSHACVRAHGVCVTGIVFILA